MPGKMMSSSINRKPKTCEQIQGPHAKITKAKVNNSVPVINSIFNCDEIYSVGIGARENDVSVPAISTASQTSTPTHSDNEEEQLTISHNVSLRASEMIDKIMQLVDSDGNNDDDESPPIELHRSLCNSIIDEKLSTHVQVQKVIDNGGSTESSSLLNCLVNSVANGRDEQMVSNSDAIMLTNISNNEKCKNLKQSTGKSLYNKPEICFAESNRNGAPAKVNFIDNKKRSLCVVMVKPVEKIEDTNNVKSSKIAVTDPKNVYVTSEILGCPTAHTTSPMKNTSGSMDLITSFASGTDLQIKSSKKAQGRKSNRTQPVVLSNLNNAKQAATMLESYSVNQILKNKEERLLLELSNSNAILKKSGRKPQLNKTQSLLVVAGKPKAETDEIRHKQNGFKSDLKSNDISSNAFVNKKNACSAVINSTRFFSESTKAALPGDTTSREFSSKNDCVAFSNKIKITMASCDTEIVCIPKKRGRKAKNSQSEAVNDCKKIKNKLCLVEKCSSETSHNSYSDNKPIISSSHEFELESSKRSLPSELSKIPSCNLTEQCDTIECPHVAEKDQLIPKKRGRKPKLKKLSVIQNVGQMTNSHTTAEIPFSHLEKHCDPIVVVPHVSGDDKPFPKKRGRKPKFKKLSVIQNVGQMTNSHTTAEIPFSHLEKHCDPIVVVSHVSGEDKPIPKKRGRKPKCEKLSSTQIADQLTNSPNIAELPFSNLVAQCDLNLLASNTQEKDKLFKKGRRKANFNTSLGMNIVDQQTETLSNLSLQSDPMLVAMSVLEKDKPTAKKLGSKRKLQELNSQAEQMQVTLLLPENNVTASNSLDSGDSKSKKSKTNLEDKQKMFSSTSKQCDIALTEPQSNNIHSEENLKIIPENIKSTVKTTIYQHSFEILHEPLHKKAPTKVNDKLCGTYYLLLMYPIIYYLHYLLDISIQPIFYF